MQNFVFDDDELRIDLGNGKTAGREYFEEQRETLLVQIEQTTDQKKRNGFKAALVVANKAIRLLDEAAQELQAVETEINIRRLKRYAEDNRIALEGDRTFRENISWIANAAYSRHTGARMPMFDADATKYFNKRVAPYRKELYSTLSYEQAQQQVDEFFKADLERREWVEVISLPKPKANRAQAA
jgi:hypothetical protein